MNDGLVEDGALEGLELEGDMDGLMEDGEIVEGVNEDLKVTGLAEVVVKVGENVVGEMDGDLEGDLDGD